MGGPSGTGESWLPSEEVALGSRTFLQAPKPPGIAVLYRPFPLARPSAEGPSVGSVSVPFVVWPVLTFPAMVQTDMHLNGRAQKCRWCQVPDRRSSMYPLIISLAQDSP